MPQDPNEPVSFQRYYEESGPDYATWSPRFNMHFGFFRRGMNPFLLEPMLEQMNAEVMARLELPAATPRVLDMGCGVGATLRSISRRRPDAALTGVTLVPWQQHKGTELNTTGPEANSVTGNIRILLADYEQTQLPAASFDACYALESSCYAHRADKAAFLTEAHRLLKPGGRLVVADGFLARPDALIGPQKPIYRKLCECWVIETLGEIHQFTARLESLGFTNIQVEPIQARVTPSVLHVPLVTIQFLVKEVIFGQRKMSPARWNNILAPILLPFVGKPIGPMAYHIVSATKA